MTEVVFSVKMLKAMHFLHEHLLDQTSSFALSVPKIDTDGNSIETLDQLSTEMNVSKKVAAYYATEIKDIKPEIVCEAQEILHAGLSGSTVQNYAYLTAKNFDKTELKGVRMVRTISGSRRFGQQRGSIIVRDGAKPLDSLIALNNDVPGYDKLADRRGRIFYVGMENGSWVVRNPVNNSVVHQGDSQEGSLEWLNQAVGGSKVPAKDKDKAPRTRASGASGARPTGDSERDEVMNALSSDKNSYNIEQGQKGSLYKLTTAQLVVYKSARDRGATHDQALKVAMAATPSEPKKASK